MVIFRSSLCGLHKDPALKTKRKLLWTVLVLSMAICFSPDAFAQNLQRSSNPELLNKFKSRNEKEVRQASREMLMRGRNPEFVSGLMDSIRNGTVVEKLKALDMVSQLHVVEAIPLMLQILDGSVKPLQTTIINILGRLKDQRAIAPLERLLARSTDEDIQMLCINSLGLLGDKKAIPLIKDKLDSPNVRVQAYAALALARLGDPIQKRLVKEFLKDKDERAQWPALQALGVMGDEGDLDVIRGIRDDKKASDISRDFAQMSDYRIRSRRMTQGEKLKEMKGFVRSEDPRIIQWALHEMVEDGSDALIKKLKDLAKDPNYEIFRPLIVNDLNLHGYR